MGRTYAEKLKDPRWQKRRLEILEAGGWKCSECGDAKSTLHVHHGTYVKGREPWDYPDEFLRVLCQDCHSEMEDALLMLGCEVARMTLAQTKALTSLAMALRQIDDDAAREIDTCSSIGMAQCIADICRCINEQRERAVHSERFVRALLSNGGANG